MVLDSHSEDADKPQDAGDGGPRTVSTAALFGTAREVAIDHEGTIYRLRITRQGKLILNK